MNNGPAPKSDDMDIEEKPDYSFKIPEDLKEDCQKWNITEQDLLKDFQPQQVGLWSKVDPNPEQLLQQQIQYARGTFEPLVLSRFHIEMPENLKTGEKWEITINDLLNGFEAQQIPATTFSRERAPNRRELAQQQTQYATNTFYHMLRERENKLLGLPSEDAVIKRTGEKQEVPSVQVDSHAHHMELKPRFDALQRTYDSNLGKFKDAVGNSKDGNIHSQQAQLHFVGPARFTYGQDRTQLQKPAYLEEFKSTDVNDPNRHKFGFRPK